MLAKSLQCGIRKMQQRPPCQCLRTHELHTGHSGFRSGSSSFGVADESGYGRSSFEVRGMDAALTQSSAISTPRLAACTDTEAGTARMQATICVSAGMVRKRINCRAEFASSIAMAKDIGSKHPMRAFSQCADSRTRPLYPDRKHGRRW